MPLVIGRRVTAEPAAGAHPAWMRVGLGALAVLALAAWVAFSPLFVVHEVEVTGAGRVAAAAVVSASGLDGRHVLGVNRRAAAARIVAQLPAVERARVACGLPARCTVTVVERAPLLAWETTEGLLWMDAAGATSPAGEPLAERWLVSGPLPVGEDGRVDAAVLVGLAELEQLGIRPGRVAYVTGRGLVLPDPAGWRVVVGQGTGMEQRLRVYAAVRAHLLESGIHPRFVDVRFPAAPYYSETNEW